MVQLNSIFNTLSKSISSSANYNNSGKKTKKNSKDEVGRKAASDLAKEAKRNQLLLTTYGSVNNFIPAAAYSKRGKKGINQDSFLVWEEFGCQEDVIFCGVFDGHGPWGHFVSKTIRNLMPSLLLCHWQESVAQNNLLGQEDSIIKHNIEFDIWKQSFYKTCAAVDQQLLHHSSIDSFYSGSTALALVRQGDLLIVANVGDSRAVLATISDDGSLVATQLTVDQKPNLPDESKRITESRGKVYSCPDEPDVHRVWMPTVKGPGLALSRAFGDYYIKDFGLISDPEITQTSIRSTDQFAILATDGVWDVISNQEAVDVVGSSPERRESAKILVEYAVCAWKQRGKSAVMDDISAVCLFFHDSITTTHHQDMKMNQKIV